MQGVLAMAACHTSAVLGVLVRASREDGAAAAEIGTCIDEVEAGDNGGGVVHVGAAYQGAPDDACGIGQGGTVVDSKDARLGVGHMAGQAAVKACGH